MYYSGIDLHWDNCYITTVDESGAIVKQQRVVNSPDMLLDYFHSMEGSHCSVVESTMGWYWLDDLLEDNGIELVLAHAKYLKAISYAKVKTDKVDSQTLATLLRLDLIPRAHKIDRSLRGLRDTMRARLRLVQKRTTSTVMLNTIRVKFNFPETLPAQYQLYAQMLEEQTDLLSEHILALEKSLHPHLIPNAFPGVARSPPSRSIWRSTASNGSRPSNTFSPIAVWFREQRIPTGTYTIAQARMAISI
jgi:transposase